MDQIAVISDIHGNIPALEAILHDIQRRNIQHIYCLGDLVGKGPNSELAVDMCREVCALIIRGNWDEFIFNKGDNPMVHWHQQRLGNKRLEYLSQLPYTIEFGMSGKSVRLFHASQQGIYARVHMNDTDEKHTAMFTNTEFTGYRFAPNVVGYGDIHRAYIKSFENCLLFNVGSVGNPLDVTQASYAILEGTYGNDAPSPFSIQLIRVPYDIERAIRQAEEVQMPDLQPYINELRTGHYRGAAPG